MGLIKNRSAPVGKAIQDLSQFKMPVFVGDNRFGEFKGVSGAVVECRDSWQRLLRNQGSYARLARNEAKAYIMNASSDANIIYHLVRGIHRDKKWITGRK